MSRYKIKIIDNVWYAFENEKMIAKSKILHKLEEKLDWHDYKTKKV